MVVSMLEKRGLSSAPSGPGPLISYKPACLSCGRREKDKLPIHSPLSKRVLNRKSLSNLSAVPTEQMQFMVSAAEPVNVAVPTTLEDKVSYSAHINKSGERCEIPVKTISNYYLQPADDFGETRHHYGDLGGAKKVATKGKKGR